MASSVKKNNLVLTLFIALLWPNFLPLSNGIDTTNGIVAQGASISPSSVASMPCLKVLIPCQIYLNPTIKPLSPSPSCCVSIEEVLSNDAKCLCDIFNSADILLSLNVTPADALKLPKACGANVDVSICKRGSSFSTNPASIIIPTNGVSDLAGSVFAAGFLSLIISLF